MCLQAVEVMVSVMADLASQEWTALRDQDGRPVLPSGGATWQDWQHQTYLMSGSLIAKGCQAAVMLAHHPQQLQDAAFEFGQNIAYAKQTRPCHKTMDKHM